MNIFCIGRNYVAHAREMNHRVPDEPVVFMKPPTALLAEGEPFTLPPFSRLIHYEGELVFRIAKRGKDIPEQSAWSYLDAITVGIDFTARDIQKRCKDAGHPWEKAKSFDGSAAVGSWCPLPDENTRQLTFSLQLNGKTVQQGNSDRLIFPVDKLISHCSTYFTLEPGDLLFTGTPEGVGPVKSGDTLTGLLSGKKVLHVPVR